MTKTTEEYGRRPIPADKWVRSTLENALFDAREALVAAEFEKIRARGAAAKADEMHLLWQSRISHLEAAMAALDAIPESAPVGRPWAFPAFLGDGLVSEGRGDGGTDGMPQSFSMIGVARQSRAGNLSGLPDGMAGYEPLSNPLPGAAGALADRPELATPLNTQPLSPPPFCDECERPWAPGHVCRGRRPKKLLRDRTTGEDSQEL